ncbi:hypothetical protein AB0K51_19170 [Kitasatospora sp. NPDC049285]|uniref:hypothetical protein n=1 Tax=Kitasatospora sp. NPDC049285 TaxID=3157096 RepID=UPI0034204608
MTPRKSNSRARRGGGPTTRSTQTGVQPPDTAPQPTAQPDQDRLAAALAEVGRQADTAAQWTAEAEALRATAVDEAETLTSRAEKAAEKLIADAEEHLARVRADGAAKLAEAEQSATAVVTAAAQQADRITAEAKAAGEQITAEAEQQATQIRADASKAATRDRTHAQEAVSTAENRAEWITTGAENRAAQVREAADKEAGKVRADAQEQAAALLADARRRAEEDRQAAQKDADAIRAQAHALREEAQQEVEKASAAARASRSAAADEADRIVSEARQDVQQRREVADKEAGTLRERAEDDAENIREQARKQAEQIRDEAARLLAQDKKDTAEALEKARALEKQAQKANDRAHLAEVAAKRYLQQATSRTARKLENQRLKREAREAERAGKPTVAGRVKAFIRANAERLLVVVPITAPMAVAWTGQAGFARDILGWIAPFTILFAAAWELSTAFTAWMYHQARKSGDAGTLYRVSTWIFASGAALMNYWHASAQVVGRQYDYATGKWVDQITYWHFTPKAVSFAAMSIVGIVLWELYASLIHRKALRAAGLVTRVRPRIGLIRWLRYPAHSFAAWSLAITDEALSTVELAWTAAANRRAMVRRTDLGVVRRFVAGAIGVGDWMPVRALAPIPNSTLVLAVTGSPNPANLPQFAVRLTRAGSPNQSANRAVTAANRELPGPRTGANPNRRELEPANRTVGEPAPAEPRTGPQQDEPEARTTVDEAAAAGSNRRTSAAQQIAEQEVLQVLELIRAHGRDTVDLAFVMKQLGMKKTTAHHRLAEARRQFDSGQVQQTAANQSPANREPALANR